MDTAKYVFLLWTFITLLGGVWGQQCAVIPTDGYTYPSGDIIIEYGNPLNLTCVLFNYMEEKHGKDVSLDITFTKNNDRTKSVYNDYIQIINSTSARLYIERPNATSDDNIACRYNDSLVCYNVISVGFKPQNVTDFKCISRNYDNLTCTWTAPNNYVKTNYSLTFTTNIKPQRPSRYFYGCPKVVKEEDKINKNDNLSCTWTISTLPQYKAAHKHFVYSLESSNIFGNNTQQFEFNHFKHVIPNRPEKFQANATSPHSISLKWEVPHAMKPFPPGMHHRILYQCEYYEKKWQFGGLITNETKNYNLTFNLMNLKYAHALCDIRISSRSAVADSDAEWAWSENATTTVRTKSKIPDAPPETNIGSFEIVTNGATRNIYVYWKQIGEEERNGQNFEYEVKIRNPFIINYSTKSFVEFKRLPAAEYHIDIWSKNEEGYSVKKSTVKVPARRLPEPQRFIKISHHDMFELKWDPPRTNEFITSYTIFWCRSENDRPYDCDGALDWITVPAETVQYNLTLPRNLTHQIAISANGLTSSSGMLWAECTIIPGKNMGKLKNVWISTVGSDFIDVDWKMDCSDQITVAQGFIIYYCQIEKGQTECIDQIKNITIWGKNERRGRVQSLKPYKTYLLMVGVIISDTAYSQTSEPMYNTTSEAAPSTPPLNIRVTNITDSSITLNWNPPLETNGKLREYVVHINDSSAKVEANNYTFSNLDSFGTYHIKLQACTVECSIASKPLVYTTLMGPPGEITKPVILGSNNSLITIGWQKPIPPRGNNDYYQLKLSYKLSVLNQSDDTLLNVTNAQNYTMACDSKKSSFYISVRGVNIIGNEHKFGPWSDALQLNNCSSPSQFLYIIIVIVFFVCVVAGVFFGSRALYYYFKSMKDVQVKLPPGLQTVVDQQPWMPSKLSDDLDRASKPDPDEELLLDKFPESRFLSDISMTGSSHDSMATSVESAPHLTPDVTKKTSLRQRNKGFNVADIKPPQPTGNYCVLGVDPKTLTSDNRYQESDSPPAYVSVDEMIKIPNPGYIPFKASDVEEISKGYVVAGVPKDLLVHDLQCETQKPFEEKSHYVRASDALPPQKGPPFSWEQPPLESGLIKSGYVSVGDALPPKNVGDVSKGYVPHRQFDATKSIKED